MKVCDGCGKTDKSRVAIVKVYGYDLCEDCNKKVIDFVIQLVKKGKVK